MIGLLFIGIAWLAMKSMESQRSKADELDERALLFQLRSRLFSSRFEVNIIRFAVDEHGNYEITGEVKNISKKAFWFVVAKLQFIDSNWSIVHAEIKAICRTDHFLPGEIRPLKFTGKDYPYYRFYRVFIDEAIPVSQKASKGDQG